MAFSAEEIKSKLERAVPLGTLSRTPTVDKPMDRPHHENMTTVSQGELDAKLLLLEKTMDGRVASIEESVKQSIKEAQETRADIKNLKWTTIVTAVATVVAIASFNATVLSNMVASFESGKNTATSQAEVKKAAEEVKKSAEESKKTAEETGVALKRIQQQLDAQDAERAKRGK